MERLTKYIHGDKHCWRVDESNELHCIERLAEYENTGLMPGEIEKLKADNAKLNDKLASVISELKGNCQVCEHYSY